MITIGSNKRAVLQARDIRESCDIQITLCRNGCTGCRDDNSLRDCSRTVRLSIDEQRQLRDYLIEHLAVLDGAACMGKGVG